MTLINQDLVKGIRIGFGFFLIVSVLSLIGFAGWHTAEQIIPGSFNGDFNFGGNISINGNLNLSNSTVLGLPSTSIPTGAIMAFYLSSCPSGWIVANGTSSTPDLRGEFIRGLDDGRGIDIGRVLGTFQSNDFQSHTHLGSALSAGSHTHSVYAAGTTYTGGYQGTGSGTGAWRATSSSGSHTHTLSINSAGGTETRPRNIALLYCMKS